MRCPVAGPLKNRAPRTSCTNGLIGLWKGNLVTPSSWEQDLDKQNQALFSHIPFASQFPCRTDLHIASCICRL